MLDFNQKDQLISLIITLAIAGFLVWLITTFIPMPDGFKKAIYVVAALCIVFYLLRAFGLIFGLMGHGDIAVPQLR